MNKKNISPSLLFLIVILSLTFIFGFINLLALFFGLELENISYFRIILWGLPVIFVLIHSFVKLSIPKSLFFFLLTSTVGFSFEYFSLKNGSYYNYNKNFLTFHYVPVSVIFYWAVVVYLSYCTANLFSHSRLSGKKLFSMLVIVFLSGLFAVLIDLILDPVQVKIGYWAWLEKGRYFGIPLANFLIWFVVTSITTFLFGLFEYLFSQKQKQKYLNSLAFLEYLGFLFYFSVLAMKYSLVAVAIIGFSITIILVAVNINSIAECLKK